MDDELGRKLQDFDLAIESAPYYGLKKNQAKKEIDMIKSVVRNNWRELSKKMASAVDTLVPDTKERINWKITHLRNEITNILHFREKG